MPSHPPPHTPLYFTVCMRHVCAHAYLLDVLLEHTQLQPLVKSNFSVLPDVLQTPLMVEHLVHHIQDAVDLQRKHSR